MTSETEAIVAAGYDAVYRAVPRSPTLWQIWLALEVGLTLEREPYRRRVVVTARRSG